MVLLLTGFITVNLVESSLLTQKVNGGISDIYDYAIELSDMVSSYDSQALYDSAVGKSREDDVRVIVVDNAGVVQVDAYSSLTGVKLNVGELTEVLSGVRDISYGYHQIDEAGQGGWAVYYTSSIVSDSQLVGAVLISQSLKDVTDSMAAVTGRLLIMYAISLIVVGFLSYFLTRQITSSIDDLKDAAMKIGSGDFTYRVIPGGATEMQELMTTFNSMTERIENTDKKRSEFISNASHELKTPITSMKIVAESLLQNEDVPAEVYREFLLDINSEMDRLNNLVKDLLLLTKLENAHTTLNFEVADVTEMCVRVVRMLTPLAEQKNISLTYDYSDYIEAYCSRSTIYEAINNLTENAIKYTPEGGSVKLKVGEYKGRFVEISVADTGVGISKEDAKNLFERFYRVDKARSRATGGTGLGLHIVWQIAKAHGGKVLVESEPGKGSTFILRIPKDKEAK